MLIFSALFCSRCLPKTAQTFNKGNNRSSRQRYAVGIFFVEFYQFKMYCCLFVNVA